MGGYARETKFSAASLTIIDVAAPHPWGVSLLPIGKTD
jgi:hypothetical protein